MFNRVRYLVVLSAALVGCETTLEIELPSVNPATVVNSYFTPDSVWSVHLSRAQSLRAEQARFIGISDAQVTITSKDGNLELILDHFGEGVYRATMTHPKPGTEYQLNVERFGHPSLQAHDYVPTEIEVEYTYKLVEAAHLAVFETVYVEAHVTVSLKDKEEERNYYKLVVVPAAADNDLKRPLLFETTAGSIVGENAPHYDISPSGERLGLRDAIFSDRTKNGERIEFSISFSFALREDCYWAYIDANTTLAGGCSPAAYLMHISKAFYDYALTYRLQRHLSAEPNSEPIAVTSNVNGGVGVFAGFVGYKLDLK